MRIAVDAMGGDYAPEQIVAGALDALDSLQDDKILLIGPEARIKELLGDPEVWQNKIIIHNATEVIGMDESPVEALRRKRDSSIAVMAKLAKEGHADVILSAGNTGACVAAAQMRMRPLPGVERPGILVVFPTIHGPLVLCDVGANITPKPSHLHQYAIMAEVYARKILKVENPTVGLISIGQEDAKGTDLIKSTNQRLKDDPSLRFIGNVEPRRMLEKPADIVICDGFAGNIILKLTEGMAESIFKYIFHEFKQQKPELLQHFMPVVEKIYAEHDYTEYGGAPLMGIDGTCIICHGNSDASAIKNAIMVSLKQARAGINEEIAKRLKSLEE